MQKKQQNSFVGMKNKHLPIKGIPMKINPEDLKIDELWNGSSWMPRRTGIRITHVPTGISSESNEWRSQHQNKFIAMQALKNKLNQLKLPEDKVILFLRLEYKGQDYDKLYKILHELEVKFPEIKVEKITQPR